VFPELVIEAIHRAKYDRDNKTRVIPEEKYEGVDYRELIPVLIASVQELSRENNKLKEELTKRDEEQQQQLNDLEKIVHKLSRGETLNGNRLSLAYLETNAPNPFSNSTIVR